MVIKSAFSLIELLIVISIVGILSAIAVPAYQNYSIRAQIATTKNLVDSIADKSTVYYSAHGTFGNAQQIGLQSDPNSGFSNPSEYGYGILDTEAQTYKTIISNGRITDHVSMTSYGCPNVLVEAHITSFGRGDNQNQQDADWVQYWTMTVDDNGTFKKLCWYQYNHITNLVGVSGDFIPGCFNTADNPSQDYYIEFLQSLKCQNIF